jgi:hypothetical protein
MPKRSLADRILDEVLTLRRPRPLLAEFGESGDEKARQDAVLNESAAGDATAENADEVLISSSAGSRRQLIVE